MMHVHSKIWIAAAAAALIAGPALADPPTAPGVPNEIDSAHPNASAQSPVYPADPQLQSGSRQGFGTAASDAWITAKVKFGLIRHPGLAPLATNVDTQNGVVTLFGTIGTEADKRVAAQQAMTVAGVKDVRNELQVVSGFAEKEVAKQDGQIRNSVEKRLGDRGALRGEDIDVEVANGVVRLTGTLERPGDRMTALSLARTTEGVRSVVDDLQLKG
jgi:hyperosmotically inducible protein